MFETAIASLFKRYFSRYINMNVDQLSAQLLYKQQLVIDSLTMNTETINEDIQAVLKLPITVESLEIGQIECSFSWSSLLLRSSSAVITVKVSRVHAVISEKNDGLWSMLPDDTDPLRKKHLLDLAEQEIEAEMNDFESAKPRQLDMRRLFMLLFEKLCIEIADLHIIYKRPAHCTIGFTCNAIQISNDSAGEQKSRHKLRLTNPGLYVDVQNTPQHSYVLIPQSSLEIFLIHDLFRADQKEHSFELEGSVHSLRVTFDDCQVRALVNTFRFIQHWAIRRTLLADPSRPKSKVSRQTVKAWWRYSALTILRMHGATECADGGAWFDRSLLIRRLHQLSSYKRLYRAYFDQKHGIDSQFSHQDALTMNDIESEFNAELLIVIRRSIIQKRVEDQLVHQEEGTTAWYSYYAQWFASKVTELVGSGPVSECTSAELDDDGRAFKEQVNGFVSEVVEGANPRESRRNFPTLRFHFSFNSIQIDLQSSAPSGGRFNCTLKNLSITNESRLFQQFTVIAIDVDDLCLCDQSRSDGFSKILFSNHNEGQQTRALRFTFSKQARSRLIGESSCSVGIRSCGFSVVCSPESVGRLHDFCRSAFDRPEESLSSIFHVWRRIKWHAVQSLLLLWETALPRKGNKSNAAKPSRLRNGRKSRCRKTIWNVYFEIHASKLMIPLLSHDSLTVDLGNARLVNVDDSSNTKTLPTCTNTAQESFGETDEDDEFLTPDSSPEVVDDKPDEETTFYPLNLTPAEQKNDHAKSASYKLSIEDVQVGFDSDAAPVLQRFNLHASVQSSVSHVWSIATTSVSLTKVVIRLSPPQLRSVWRSLNYWIARANNFIPESIHSSITWPDCDCHFEEIDIALHDGRRTQLDIRLESVEWSMENQFCLRNFIFSLGALSVADSLNETVRADDPTTIRTAINFLAASFAFDDGSTVDVKTKKFHLALNVNTICTLISSGCSGDLFDEFQRILTTGECLRQYTRCQIHVELQEIHARLGRILPAMLPVYVHVTDCAVGGRLNPFTALEITLGDTKLSSLSGSPKGSSLDDVPGNEELTLIVDLNARAMIDGSSRGAAFRLLATYSADGQYSLSISFAHLCLFNSADLVDSVKESFQFISRQSHLISAREPEEETRIVLLLGCLSYLRDICNRCLISSHRCTLTADFQTVAIISLADILLLLDRTRIETVRAQSSNFKVAIARIDMQPTSFELMDVENKKYFASRGLADRFVEDLALTVRLQVGHPLIQVDSDAQSPLRIFLSQNRIRSLRKCLGAALTRTSAFFSDFTFRLSSLQIIVTYQVDRDRESDTLCQLFIDQCRVSFDRSCLGDRKAVIRFHSLQIKDSLSDVDDVPIVLSSPSFIELDIRVASSPTQQWNLHFGSIRAKFVKATWMVLSETVESIRTAIRSSKTAEAAEGRTQNEPFNEKSTEILASAESVLCLFQENAEPLMSLNLQRLSFRVSIYSKPSGESWTIHSQLDSISGYDLLAIDQLYGERLHSDEANAFVLTFMTAESSADISDGDRSAYPRLHLRMASIQYVHTHRFLLSLSDVLNRFWHDEYVSHRFQMLVRQPVARDALKSLNGIQWTAELDDVALVLPEDVPKKQVLVFQVAHVNISSGARPQTGARTLVSLEDPSDDLCKGVTRFDSPCVQIRSARAYLAQHCLPSEANQVCIRFSNFVLSRIAAEISSSICEPFNVRINVEPSRDEAPDRTASVYSIEIKIPSMKCFVDPYGCRVVRDIASSALNHGPIVSAETSSALSRIIAKSVGIELRLTVEVEDLGFELVAADAESLMFNRSRSFGSISLSGLHVTFDQSRGANQHLGLRCSTVRLLDTGIPDGDMILWTPTSSNSHQIEVHLTRTELNTDCRVVLDGTRCLVIHDWCLKLTEFLRGLNEAPFEIDGSTLCASITVQLRSTHLQLVLASTMRDPYTNAFVFSSTTVLHYTKAAQSFSCFLTDLVLSTCQIGCVEGTKTLITEPTECSLMLHTTDENIREQVCEIDVGPISARLAFSDIKVLYPFLSSTYRQISQARAGSLLFSRLVRPMVHMMRSRRPSGDEFASIKSVKLVCSKIHVCLIDDCLGTAVPLLNVDLRQFKMNTVENDRLNRVEQSEFQFDMSYYNRFQSGFEPLVETCQMKVSLRRSALSSSLFVSSNQLINVNFTKAMYDLFKTIRRDWLAECWDSKNHCGIDASKRQHSFRQVKQFDSCCFRNMLGVQIRFRTSVVGEQRFSTREYIVDDRQAMSFNFPSRSSDSNDDQRQHSSAQPPTNMIVDGLLETDRRVLISIDGWKCLHPISVDRVGKLFQVASPSEGSNSFDVILLVIEVALTGDSTRTITVKSPVELRNQLTTSVDVRLECHSRSSHEFCLEPNEVRSVPVQFCSAIQCIQVRPAGFGFAYCNDPVNWSDVKGLSGSNGRQKNDGRPNPKKHSVPEDNTIYRQSFLRACFFDEKEAAYYICFRSKQICISIGQTQQFFIYRFSVLPPLAIYNLLPCSMNLEIATWPQKLELNAYKFHFEHVWNIAQPLNIRLTANLYSMRKALCLPSIDELYCAKYTQQRVVFYDDNQRELMVDVSVVCSVMYSMKIFVSVAYVLFNKSGIPLIVKDVNSKVEAAGQSQQDEIALNREPLLFSFSDSNGSGACVLRVGTGLHQHQDGSPQWSQRFSLEPGSVEKQLKVTSRHNDQDWSYSITVDIRPGDGYLKKTSFVFLNARHIICNQTSHELLVAQQAIVDDYSKWIRVLKHATSVFHWPRTDLKQLLCVRISDDSSCRLIYWSGGFHADHVDSFHVNMRCGDDQCLLLQVQCLERNGTYFVVFMDSNQAQVPFRICNRSNIPIQFCQTDVREDLDHLHTVIRPHRTIDYALDEPTLKPAITCSVADGTKTEYDLLKIGFADNLCYPNQIYLVLQNTFESEDPIEPSCADDESKCSSGSSGRCLVIEYADERLNLSVRQENKRSQLWAMTSNGQLVHVASSRIRDGGASNRHFDDFEETFVLDVRDTNHYFPSHAAKDYFPLTVRHYDQKRALTQTWQFLENGYLCMANTCTCIRVLGELTPNSDVVLGPMPESKDRSAPAAMHVRPQRRYEGAGHLFIRIMADGPTHILEIDHVKPIEAPNNKTSFSSLSNHDVDLHFPAGIGLSLVGSMGHEAEEILYIHSSDLHIEYSSRDDEHSVDATIHTLNISNQLLDTTKPCLLYVPHDRDGPVQSAVHFQVDWRKTDRNVTLLRIIHSLRVDVNSTIHIQLDELLLWKLVEFFDVDISPLSSWVFRTIRIGGVSNISRKLDLNVSEYDTQRILSLFRPTRAGQIYFNQLYVSPIDLKLSVCCIQSGRSLPARLVAIKQRSICRLVPFENAEIQLRAYQQTHVCNTYDCFLRSLMAYYINVCTRQILKIAGTADYLGNPLGLIHDVSDGLNCLVDQGSVSGLVKNVTHGVADSTSKVTSSLSHGLRKFVSTNEPANRRLAVAERHRGSAVRHAFRQGTVDLAAGFYGGITSMIREPYRGVTEDGMPGLVKGLAKGIVETVSRPMVGILDFTNEVASAVRESVSVPNSILQKRIRPIRCPSNLFGLLEAYSFSDAQGHTFLYKLNSGNAAERYVSQFTLSVTRTDVSDKQIATSSGHDVRFTAEQQDICTNAMVTTHRVIVYRTSANMQEDFNAEIISSYDFDSSITIPTIEDDHGISFIKFSTDRPALPTALPNTRPQYVHRCDSLELAHLFIREVQRAQERFREENLVYASSLDEDDELDFDVFNGR